jgi:formylglycine-generating enzyme
MKARFALMLGALALACGEPAPGQLPPAGQIVLYITTNAPLPPAPGETLLASEPPALFDRLRVEVYEPGSNQPCSECSREFELDRVRVREGGASIGIVPPPGASGYVARARLYRAISVKGGEPPPLSTIDVYAALPEVTQEGIVEAGVVLDVEDVGHPLGTLATPTLAQPGKPNFSAVQTWARAARVPCTGTAGPGEACVPGGAFWMGHPYAMAYEDGSDASDSRLVVVSPFYVDLREVTVADYRASALATLEEGTSIDPSNGRTSASDSALTPDNPQWFCTYTDAVLDAENSRENQPLNCVSWHAANAFCGTRGKMLPSEAEYEYMATGLRSDPFVWGEEQAACGDSVWGRGGVGYDQCLTQGDPGGPLPPGSGRRDRLQLAEGEVLDLAGNVSEWTRDYWNRSNELCWVDQPLLHNPQCIAPSTLDGDRRTIKGGPWIAYIPPASFRIGRPPDSTLRPQTGFRCVRPGR